jgi:hypothetical protein
MIENLKIYGINFITLALSITDSVNPFLQTILLSVSIVYTGIKIFKNLNDAKDR